MARGNDKTIPCDDRTRAGRHAKMEQFWTAAGIINTLTDDDQDLVDAYVTLCVHAGIAASDVICCVRKGYHPAGENHNEATGILGEIDKEAAKNLDTLLRLKTRSGYSGIISSGDQRKRACAARAALVVAASKLA